MNTKGFKLYVLKSGDVLAFLNTKEFKLYDFIVYSTIKGHDFAFDGACGLKVC